VTLHPDVSFVYQAQPGFWGQDFFRYKATDGQNESLTATVYVAVQRFRDPKIEVIDTEAIRPSDVGRAKTDPDFVTELHNFIHRKHHTQEFENVTFSEEANFDVARTAGFSGYAIFWTKRFGQDPYDLSTIRIKVVPFYVVFNDTIGKLEMIQFVESDKLVPGPKSTAEHETWHTNGARIALFHVPSDADSTSVRFDPRPGFRVGAIIAKNQFVPALRGYVTGAQRTRAEVEAKVNELFGLMFSADSYLKFGAWHNDKPRIELRPGGHWITVYKWLGYELKIDGKWVSALPEWSKKEWLTRWLDENK